MLNNENTATGLKQAETISGSGYRPMLQMPASVQGVQEAESTYGANWLQKLNDPSGKYIGSTIKPIDPAAKVRAQEVMNQTEAGKAYNDAMGISDGKALNLSKDIASTASQTMGSLFNATANMAQNTRLDDLRQWQEKGKYWFDPNADLKPDLDKYLTQMPKATGALVQGSPIARLGEKNSIASTALINPSAFKVKNQAISNVLNPLNLFDKSQGKGFANYVGSKAAQGAFGGLGAGMSATGAASGLAEAGSKAVNFVGAGIIIGALVGMVEGIFSWGAAKEEDAKNAQKAREEYEIALREWTVNRNKRISSLKTQKYLDQQAATEKAKATSDAKDAKRTSGIAERRRRIESVLSSAGSISSANRAKRTARF